MGNKIGIIYFSGTGNTKFVAQNIAKKLQQWGEELDLINIEKDKIIPTHYKYLIIGGPIYIDRYPEILIKYAKDKLKNYKNKCMLFATQASEKDSTAYQHFINNNINPIIEVDENIRDIISDEGAITRIFTNLIGNIIKHGESYVKITLKQKDDVIITEFINKTTDLTEENVDKLFKRFYTVDKS